MKNVIYYCFLGLTLAMIVLLSHDLYRSQVEPSEYVYTGKTPRAYLLSGIGMIAFWIVLLVLALLKRQRREHRWLHVVFVSLTGLAILACIAGYFLWQDTGFDH